MNHMEFSNRCQTINRCSNSFTAYTIIMFVQGFMHVLLVTYLRVSFVIRQSSGCQNLHTAEVGRSHLCPCW